MTYDASPAFAAAQDAADPLASFRAEFHVPAGPGGRPVAYFCGNSLGLLPRAARAAVEAEFQAWETKAVEGHFHGESALDALPGLAGRAGRPGGGGQGSWKW